MLKKLLCHQAAWQPSGCGPRLVLHRLSSSGGGFLAVTPLSTGTGYFATEAGGVVLPSIANQGEITKAPQLVSHET